MTARQPDPAPGTAHPLCSWQEAREIAAAAARGAGRHVLRPLEDALGTVLAAPLEALSDLPPFDTSAMDGWALSGPGPWLLDPDGGPGILAGRAAPPPLPDGHAVPIATGARVPPGTTAVLRREHGEVRGRGPARDPGGEPGAWLYAAAAGRCTAPGQDIRPRGQECRSGDPLLPAGTPVTPAVLGLAAAAGYDELSTVRPPRVDVLILGDELLSSGLPRDGRIRDALGPMLDPWLRALGADVTGIRHLGDRPGVLHEAVTGSTADLIVTTGGTASGPVDHIHPVLHRAGAELLVDGVAVRPGHPMLLARTAPGRHLVGLPGNPLAAVSALLTLAEPLLRTLSGRVPGVPLVAPAAVRLEGHPTDTRLLPVVFRSEEVAPLPFTGPAMLRGVATADGLAVVPPGGTEAGDEAEILELPWHETGSPVPRAPGPDRSRAQTGAAGWARPPTRAGRQPG